MSDRIATEDYVDGEIAGTYAPGGTDVALADGGTGSSTAAGARTNLDVPSNAEAVLDTLFNANTVLAADTDDTPAALTMGASTILARLAAGNIKAATPAELRTLLALVVGTDVQAFDADLAAIAALADPNADRLLFWDDSAGAWTHLTLGTNLSITDTTINASGGSSQPYVHLRDEQAANTAGGGSTAGGVWFARVLNTEVVDADGICSLASNQFTLSAGTYRINARAPFTGPDQFKLRIYNATDVATVLIGSSHYAPASGAQSGDASLRGQFTIAASKALELQYRVQTAKTTNGLGVASNFAVTEVYAEVELWKTS